MNILPKLDEDERKESLRAKTCKNTVHDPCVALKATSIVANRRHPQPRNLPTIWVETIASASGCAFL